MSRPNEDAALTQRKTLKKLLLQAKDTSFGINYDFSTIMQSRNIEQSFRDNVPISDYNQIFNNWWKRLLDGEGDVVWPGRIKNFALSSGTSEASSKIIPVSKNVQRSMRKVGLKMFMNLANLDLDPRMYEKSMLMIGGSSSLQRQLDYRMGDLSGINSDSPPIWIRNYYKPGREISKIKDWNERTKVIAELAPQWDIGYISGIPSWVLITLQTIVKHHKLDSIHDLWPDLGVFVSGGINYKPYLAGFNKLFSKKVTIFDSYLASEGFIAYQTNPEVDSMQLICDGGIYFEFVPFNDDNFDQEGNIKSHAYALNMNEVVENQVYALLISNNSGAWRYLIGDTVIFKDAQKGEIQITGRTKHFLSICGEHLSIENMTSAIMHIQDKININIQEFTVGIEKIDDTYHHKWYIGTEQGNFQIDFSDELDTKLCLLNDDYCTERKAGILGKPIVHALPTSYFYQFMEENGRLNGQAKFPRVMKSERFESWELFLKRQNWMPN